MDKLNKCPHCDDSDTVDILHVVSGKHNNYHHYFFVKCDNCEMEGPHCRTYELATRGWNKLPRNQEWEDASLISPSEGIVVIVEKQGKCFLAFRHFGKWFKLNLLAPSETLHNVKRWKRT